MSIQLLVILLVALLNLSLGLLALLKNGKSATNRLIFALSIVFASWSIFNYFSLNSPTEAQTLFWIRMVMVATAPLGPVVLFLVYSFPFSSVVLPKKIYIGLIALTLIVGILALTPAVFTDVEIVDGNITPTPGPGIFLYVLLFFGSLIATVVRAVKRYKKSRGLEKLQFRYFFIGLILTFGLQVLTNFALVLLNISGLVALGPSFSLIFVGFLTYSIIRHRLLDLKLVAARTIVYLFILVFIVTLYSVLLFSFSTLFLGSNPSLNEVLVYALISVVVAVTFSPIQSFFSRVTNTIFYRRSYQPSVIFHKLTEVLNNTPVIDEALTQLGAVLSETMHVRYSVFALKLTGRKDIPREFTEKSSEYAMYSFGENEDLGVLPSYLHQVLERSRKALLYDDLTVIDFSKLERTEQRLKQWMAEKKVGVLLPLYSKDDVIGYIILGEKLNGDAFTSQDVSVLETFGLQASIGIENILLFMYTKDFNKQLKSSVDRATGQLKAKNRTLELLRKMDSIITTSLELQDVCQKIVDTLSWELGYDITYLSLVDEKQGVLKPMAVAHTPIAEKAAAIVAGYEDRFEISVTETTHPIMQVFHSGKRFESEHLTEVFAGKVPDNVLRSLHEIHQIQGVLVYPIFAKQKAIGTLLVAIPVAPSKLTASEMELLEEFVKEVGIALDNAMLYEEGKRTNQALIDTNKRLIELDRMKDEFVSIASHELRTPMTAINSYVWMALNKGGEMSEKAKEYLGKVAISTQRLIDLVNDMLNVSRIESGRVEVKHEPFDIVALIRDVHEELHIKAQERHLELSFNLESRILNQENGGKILAVGDANKTREVLTNFLGNSLKFTEQGKVWTTLDVKDSVVDGETVHWVEVSVNDTGRGIGQEDMPRLFTKFGRLENELSTIAQTQGTGLGLFICKKYIEAMHGEVGAESELGKGSRFWFRLRTAS